jgi:hypothetical protein
MMVLLNHKFSKLQKKEFYNALKERNPARWYVVDFCDYYKIRYGGFMQFMRGRRSDKQEAEYMYAINNFMEAQNENK